MHPIAFQFGPFTVHAFGVMIALAFMAGLWTATRRCPRDGLNPDDIADLIPWLLGGSILGARALHVLEYWSTEFAGRPLWEIAAVWKGGLVFYGGFIGAVITVLIYIRVKRLPAFKVGDALVPSVALGSALGRIGCLLNGCCFGSACAAPWAIHFPRDHETLGAGVHPTQLYDAGLNVLLFVGLEWLYRRKKFDGQVFACFLIGYALLRSFVECFRGDYGAHRLGPLTSGQLLSIATLGVGLFLLWRLPRPARPA